jgi:hypothetical protein
MRGRSDSARRAAVALLCLVVSSACGEQRDPGAGVGGSGGNAGTELCELASESFSWPEGENTPVPAPESRTRLRQSCPSSLAS